MGLDGGWELGETPHWTGERSGRARILKRRPSPGFLGGSPAPCLGAGRPLSALPFLSGPSSGRRVAARSPAGGERSALRQRPPTLPEAAAELGKRQRGMISDGHPEAGSVFTAWEPCAFPPRTPLGCPWMTVQTLAAAALLGCGFSAAVEPGTQRPLLAYAASAYLQPLGTV